MPYIESEQDMCSSITY